MASSTTPGRPTDHVLTERILAEAAEMLLETGYGGLKIERLAARVGCGKAAIYRRYADKARLAAAVFRSRVQIGEVPDCGNVVDDLVEHALTNQRNQSEAGASARVGVSLLFEADVFPSLWDEIFAVRHRNGVTLIERGIARGELPADADPDLILDTIAGLTIYRQTIKGILLARGEYHEIVSALVANPPRRAPEEVL